MSLVFGLGSSVVPVVTLTLRSPLNSTVARPLRSVRTQSSSSLCESSSPRTAGLGCAELFSPAQILELLVQTLGPHLRVGELHVAREQHRRPSAAERRHHALEVDRRPRAVLR